MKLLFVSLFAHGLMAAVSKGDGPPESTKGKTPAKEKAASGDTLTNLADKLKAEADALKAKIEAIAAENEKAREEIAAYFGENRWGKIVKQSNMKAEQLTKLCGDMRRSRREWDMVEGNDKAALILAAHHVLVSIHSEPTAEDTKALEEALSAPQASA